MKCPTKLLQTIHHGARTFLRDDFPDDAEFVRLVAELRKLDELGFLKGYRENCSRDAGKKIMSVAASHGLSDEGTDYLVRVGV